MDKLGRRGDEHRKMEYISGLCKSYPKRYGEQVLAFPGLIRKSSEDEVSRVWVRNTPATRGSCGVHG